MAAKTFDFLEKINKQVDDVLKDTSGSRLSGDEVEYLRKPAPNICEWVTGVDYWGMPSCYNHSRQYQIMRDVFCCRCPVCNSMKLEDIDCWGKSRMYLESEVLLTWKESEKDFVCPKCGNTQHQFIQDGMFVPYNEMIILAGMRSGKSYLGAHIGGYFEHFISTRAMWGQGHLQQWLHQAKAEWFEVSFAASTETQASQTIYAKYREMRKGSPWLNRYITWVKAHESSQLGTDKWEYRVNDKAVLDGWAQVRYNLLASDSAGIAGKTRLAAGIDEWARLSDTEGSRSASELSRVLTQSLMTVRASVMLNKLPPFLGMMINVTSPIAQDDPAMERFNQAREGIAPSTYAWKGPTWEFNPYMPRYVFDEAYQKDPVGAERDFGANPPNAESPFVNDPKRFWKSIDFDRKSIAEFSVTNLTDPTGKSYVGAELAHCELDHVNVYYLFCDAGLTWDSFGMVCAHPEWIPVADFEDTVEGPDGQPLPKALRVAPGRGRINPASSIIFEGDDGYFLKGNSADVPILNQSLSEIGREMGYAQVARQGGRPYDHMGEVLCTVIDFALRIVPTQDRDIWFNSVVNIVEGLQKKIRIAGVAFDRWNSESTIQQLRSMNLLTTKVTLKPENFMGFLTMAYNGRVKMLPPAKGDVLGLTDTGALMVGTPQELMQGQSVALVELLKLSRSADLRKIYNPKKGVVRGRDSDDLARCYVGAHHLVQDSIVDDLAESSKRNAIMKRQLATEASSFGMVVRGKNF